MWVGTWESLGEDELWRKGEMTTASAHVPGVKGAQAIPADGALGMFFC